MNMQRYNNLWLPLALAILMFSRAACAAAPQIDSIGPLQLQPAGVKPTYSRELALQEARNYLGESGTAELKALRFVQVTDHTSYGNISKTVFYAWEITATGVPVAAPGSKVPGATIDLTLLLDGGKSKKLDAIYTTRNATKWIARDPSYPARKPDEAMAEDGWRLAPLSGTRLSSSIPRILSAFWQSSEINPADAGQLFLRPCNVTLSLPVSRDANGKLVSLHPRGTYWMVVVSGTKTLDVIVPTTSDSSAAQANPKDGHYMTGLIALYDDIGATSVRGIYLP